jgi:putative transposase
MLKKIWSDAGYRGNFETKVQEDLKIEVEVVSRQDEGAGVWHSEGKPPPTIPKGFEVVKWRWIVERTFGWIGRHRRMSKDYEGLLETSRAFIWLVLIRVLAARLAHPQALEGTQRAS